jgi:hypothetical protein
MTPLALQPKLLSLANTLGIRAEDPITGIREYCVKRIQKLIRGAERSIKNIYELQKIVCEKLNLTVYEVWSGAELQQLVASYVETDSVFAYLPTDLNDNTYGVLIRLNRRVGKHFAWAAIVDCRADKRHRRFFTTWHEIVHCITAADQYELPFHRTIIRNKPGDPIERLVDVVAGDLGFFDPIFRPHLERELQVAALTFETVEKVRNQFCPEASFESTLNACIDRCESPALLLKAAMILKSAEQAAVESPQRELFRVPAPRRRLRVASSLRNDAARKIGLHIPRHFRIPKSSIMTRIFSADMGTTTSGTAIENLSLWTTSKGTHLPSVKVHVAARKVGDEVVAILTSVGGSKQNSRTLSSPAAVES